MWQSFQSDVERSAWIQAHADYWSIIWFRGEGSPGHYDRAEEPTLDEARGLARWALTQDPSSRLVLYAVSGVQSCYVETIKGE